MKNRSLIITLIFVLSIIAFSLLGGMFFLINKGFDFDFTFGPKNMDLIDSLEIDAVEIKNIKLNLYSTDIEIKESNTNNINVEYYSNKKVETKIKREKDAIIVDEEGTNSICIGICFNRRKVVLSIPKNYNGEYNIETRSGDIASSIDMEKNVVNIITTSGDINLNNTLLINIKTTSGDIEINSIKKSFDFKTTSGDVDINNLEIDDNSSIKTTSGDIKINNNISNCYIEVDTISGDKIITTNNRKSDIVLKIKTTSGDIRVN